MAIKNFKAPQKQPEKLSGKPILVSDYMTKKLIMFKPEQSVLEVMDILIKYRISGGPVVDSKGELLGIISEGDCMKQISESRYFNMPMGDETVEKYMVADVETIDGNMNIFDAATLFYKSNRRRFPVMENGKLVGQISRKDVLKGALTLSGQTWK
ncbi:CBS domain-containing protein [Urechidicola croceus]|uniref:Inosine-5-monophosphate dehydrogenase n=1 Tax=Urechidicola croceus TaxID=1850246 RepID=A0A1D8P9Q5_9FLAO|nr:CBS domain-containing protein [Urechidicola croceus]AOW21332.1 inosine-5-monophosphate dehydrogenase [Urechidicola croceus]